MAGFTKAEKMEAAASIYEMMLAGESDDAIMAALGMNADLFYETKRFMLDSKATELRSKPREVVYAEYVIEQRANVRQIDTLLTSMSGPDGKKHYNAFVGALRLRSDIADKVLDRGFDLGIIRKTPEQHELVGGIAVAGMSQEDLVKAINEMTAKTGALLTMGDVDLLSVDAGALHRGPGVIDALAEDGEDDEALLKAPPPAPVAKPAAPRPPGSPRPALPLPTERHKAPAAPPVSKPPAKPAPKSPPPKR